MKYFTRTSPRTFRASRSSWQSRSLPSASLQKRIITDAAAAPRGCPSHEPFKLGCGGWTHSASPRGAWTELLDPQRLLVSSSVTWGKNTPALSAARLQPSEGLCLSVCVLPRDTVIFSISDCYIKYQVLGVLPQFSLHDNVTWRLAELSGSRPGRASGGAEGRLPTSPVERPSVQRGRVQRGRGCFWGFLVVETITGQRDEVGGRAQGGLPQLTQANPF